MFDPGILADNASDRQRSAVNDVMRKALDNDTFTYTELLSEKEPLRTYGLEFLDGVKVQDNGIPIYGIVKVEHWHEQGGRHLLVHLDPKGTIKYMVREEVRVPGINKIRPENVMKDFGNIALFTDALGDRVARNILFLHGYPVRQNVTEGNMIGTVVEWKWLEKEAALGAGAAHGILELHAEMKHRVAAFEAAQAKKAADAREAKITKSKTPGTSQVGA